MNNSVTSEMSQLKTNTEQEQEVNMMDVDIKDANTSLNVLVAFLNLAHKRGVFNIQESAKIWECINFFQKST
tara:strand:+ start:2406 stop:2621 length:216 start_codon:yes stop_codon:yes gene_type:complete